MTETEKMETTLTTQHYQATSSFGGSAMNAHRERSRAGKPAQKIEPLPKSQQGALTVLEEAL